MKILVIGNGGREHALCWKIAQSPLVQKLFCAPGNPGTAAVAENVSISPTDLPRLLQFAKQEQIDLTVVGPEDALCGGIVDLFEAEKLKIFGPSQRAAQIEGSKSFCKELLRRHRIPTAAFKIYDSSGPAMAYLETNITYPLVVKASGLAAGKGVFVCKDREEARDAIEKMMGEKRFGSSGETVLIEDFLQGQEASVLTLTDGETIIPLEPSQDHKAVFDNDQGPNTGGMGAICPTPAVAPRILYQIESQVLVPTIHALNREGRRFSGILYAGLMLTTQGPKVLEFNARFGDPETQAVLLRFRSDLVPYLLHCAEGRLDEMQGIDWDERVAVCVVAASKGYPGDYAKGKTITGLDRVSQGEDLQVFQAGTVQKDGVLQTSGGRVLGVAALGQNWEEARQRAYAEMEHIQFEGKHFRRDIGFKALPKAMGEK